MIWYVYDANRSGADVVFFRDRNKAEDFRISRAATTGGDMKIRWCHVESVPDNATIY